MSSGKKKKKSCLVHNRIFIQCHQRAYTETERADYRPVPLPTGSTDCICFATVGTNDPVTSALHIIVGESESLFEIPKNAFSVAAEVTAFDCLFVPGSNVHAYVAVTKQEVTSRVSTGRVFTR